MKRQRSLSGRLARGFTLTELMITLAVAAILVSIAVASYSTQTQKAHRTDAKQAILDLAGREESYFSVNNNYGTTWLSVGYSTAATATTTALAVAPNNYYNVQVCVPAGTAPCPASALAAPSYQVIATPVAGGPQVKDTSCQQFMVDSSGAQSSTDGSGNNTTSTCWAQ